MKVFASLLILLLLTGCETTAPVVTAQKITALKITAMNFDYPQYFLATRAMDQQALIGERKRLKTLLSNTSTSTLKKIGDETLLHQLQLAILYSQPDVVTHNPYDAKALLNQLSFSQHKISQQQVEYSQFSLHNQAFFMMLREQLNQQLFIYNDVAKQKAMNDTLQSAIEQLKAKIIKLKNIEKTISLRG